MKNSRSLLRLQSARLRSKNLSIPEWLNEEAIALGINFSQVLQDASVQKARASSTNFIKKWDRKNPISFFNETRGIRTPDNLIKSQVLYQLS